ncbi:queuosine salvage family protein [Desulfovibrio sp. JY]|nr:queuosine salvage family protein [Desulfovibrio sp. JY]
MSNSLFRRIRDETARVCRTARFVTINDDAIPAYAAGLDLAALAAPRHDPKSHYLGHGADTALFFLILDAVNFGSGYFPHLCKVPGRSGYFTVATRLTERFAAKGPLHADALLAMTPHAAAELFQQDATDPVVMELMGLFARALHDLGRLLDQEYGGSAPRLIEAASGSAERLCRILAQMELFRDEQPYMGHATAFYKRAQLTAADLAVAFDGQGPGRFDDLGELTVFADNLVPHVLRLDGILRFEAGFTARIAAGELLEKDSPQEVEMRAATVQAVERMAAVLRERGQKASPLQLDFLLWNKGQRPASKAVPRPRCRTWYY